MDFAGLMSRHRRLVLLRGLASAPNYSANESILTGICDQWRVTSTRDQVRTDLGWLSDQGMVVNEIIGDYLISTLTQAGHDVAAGKRVHPDIEKPAPRRS